MIHGSIVSYNIVNVIRGITVFLQMTDRSYFIRTYFNLPHLYMSYFQIKCGKCQCRHAGKQAVKQGPTFYIEFCHIDFGLLDFSTKHNFAIPNYAISIAICNFPYLYNFATPNYKISIFAIWNFPTHNFAISNLAILNLAIFVCLIYSNLITNYRHNNEKIGCKLEHF